jgi:hypothetical protein
MTKKNATHNISFKKNTDYKQSLRIFVEDKKPFNRRLTIKDHLKLWSLYLFIKATEQQ